MNWKTPPKVYNELPQVTDSYVVHARGFTVHEDIWLDYYSLRKEHKNWWNNQLSEEYDCEYDDDCVLYWSITGSGKFLIQERDFSERSEQQEEMLKETLEAIQFPKRKTISWKDSTGRRNFKRNNISEVF